MVWKRGRPASRAQLARSLSSIAWASVNRTTATWSCPSRFDWYISSSAMRISRSTRASTVSVGRHFAQIAGDRANRRHEPQVEVVAMGALPLAVVDPPADALGHGQDLFRIAELQQREELVAARSRHGGIDAVDRHVRDDVGAALDPDGGLQDPADRRERAVAGAVAIGVVDRLEIDPGRAESRRWRAASTSGAIDNRPRR